MFIVPLAIFVFIDRDERCFLGVLHDQGDGARVAQAIGEGVPVTLLAVLADAAEAGLTVTLCTDPGHEALLRQRTTAALT